MKNRTVNGNLTESFPRAVILSEFFICKGDEQEIEENYVGKITKKNDFHEIEKYIQKIQNTV